MLTQVSDLLDLLVSELRPAVSEANPASASYSHVLLVVFVRAIYKMIWVTAGRVVTGVPAYSGPTAMGQEEGDPMNASRLAFPPNSPVSVPVTPPLPLVATVLSYLVVLRI